MDQQKRVITGHVLRRTMEVTKGGWRDRYRDSRQLSETVQAILAGIPSAALLANDGWQKILAFYGTYLA
jgi:hypothetical protein